MPMLTFKYTARDTASGKQVQADVQADNEAAAIKLIRDQGYTPIDIKEEHASKSPLAVLKNRISTKDKVLFSRQLATLINAGLPLVQSLRSVNSQTTNKALKVVINDIISSVEAGTTLGDSMSKHPKVFNKVYLSLIAAGETSGTLDLALERLANQQEKDADIVSKVRGAMIYPLIVLLVMIGVMLFMVLKVLPQVKTLYEDIPGASLPLVTAILLGLSDAIIKYWPFFIVFLVVIGILTGRAARSTPGKSIIDKYKMRGWPINSLFMKMYMARFSRTSTTLVSSGVPLIQVLEITARSINNVHLEKSVLSAIEKIKTGKSLGDSLSGDPNFLELVPNMIKIGEQSGSMEQMLEKSADYYEKELDNEIKAISTIIEPVMMVLMGIMAFIIVAAVLLPIYNLAGQSGSLAG